MANEFERNRVTQTLQINIYIIYDICVLMVDEEQSQELHVLQIV
jgi:hypothetical protein